MWKIAVGFVLFAGIGFYVLLKGGDIDLSGEKHGTEAAHVEPAKPAAEAAAATPAVPAAAAPVAAPAAAAAAKN